MGVSVALQKKIYDTANEDPTIKTTFGCKVFDHVPDNTPRPYIVIGEDIFSDLSTHTVDSFKVEMQMDVWTEGEGKKRNKEILDRLYDIFHEKDLELEGQKTISLRCDFMHSMIDPDGRTYHGIIKFNLLLGG